MTTATSTEPQSQTFAIAKDDSKIDVPRGPVKAPLTFFAPPPNGEAPYHYVEDPPEGMPKDNWTSAEHEVPINDIRGRESAFDINTNGFTTLSGIPSDEQDFTSDDSIKRVYYPEVERLLLAHVPDAQRIHLFDHTVRRSGPNAHRAPVTRAHVDQTTASARQRVRNHMGPDDAPALLEGRVRLINVWRPLNGPVVDKPLAFADSASVPDADIVGVEHRYPDRTGETAGVYYSDAGNWYYWSGMGNDERILLQCFDSRDGARTPHTAFVDPRTRDGWPERESIEVRALVFG